MLKFGLQINLEKYLRLKIHKSCTNYWINIINMRYSTEPKFKKYVKVYGFLSFVRKFGDKYVKKLMDTATKTGIDAAKTAS